MKISQDPVRNQTLRFMYLKLVFLMTKTHRGRRYIDYSNVKYPGESDYTAFGTEEGY